MPVGVVGVEGVLVGLGLGLTCRSGVGEGNVVGMAMGMDFPAGVVAKAVRVGVV